MPLSLTRRLHGHITIIHKGLTSSQHASEYQKKKRKKQKMKNEKKETKLYEATEKAPTSHAFFTLSSIRSTRMTNKQTDNDGHHFFSCFFPFFLQLHFSLGVNGLTSRMSSNASIISLIPDRPIKTSSLCSFQRNQEVTDSVKKIDAFPSIMIVIFREKNED